MENQPSRWPMNVDATVNCCMNNIMVFLPLQLHNVLCKNLLNLNYDFTFPALLTSLTAEFKYLYIPVIPLSNISMKGKSVGNWVSRHNRYYFRLYLIKLPWLLMIHFAINIVILGVFLWNHEKMINTFPLQWLSPWPREVLIKISWAPFTTAPLSSYLSSRCAL